MPKMFWFMTTFLFVLNFAIDHAFATKTDTPFVEEQTAVSGGEKRSIENSITLSKAIAKINLKAMDDAQGDTSRSIASDPKEENPSTINEPRILRVP